MSLFKQIFALSLFVIIASTSSAQVVGGMNFKMEKLYMEEKYGAIISKGEGMIENDKYKKDPEIYLYISMSFFELSQSNDEDVQEDYPKALKNAFKYAAKFVKKDRDGVWYEDNGDFFEDLKKAGIADAAQWIDDPKKLRVAVSSYKYMTKAMPDDWNLLFFKGVLEQMNRNTGQAERDIAQAMTNLVQLYENPKYRPSKASKPVLEDGMIRWADIMLEQDYADSAKKTMNWAIQFFPDNEKITAKAASFN
ncbi:hypothetical protein OAE48_00525 [Flavobacteriales bacterium]|nr:hypothetical protein [Flavobacteriales bacterium]